MGFKKYKHNTINNSARVAQSKEFKKQIKSRRSVRDFSKKDVSKLMIQYFEIFDQTHSSHGSEFLSYEQSENSYGKP